MPSPRAVLSDIHDFGLNPKEPWSAVGKKGRLKKPQDSTLAEVKSTVETIEVSEPEVINVPVQPEPIVDVQDENEEQEWAELVRQVELEEADLVADSDEMLTTPEVADSADELESSRSKKKKK
jgi:predicted dehydrogenase